MLLADLLRRRWQLPLWLPPLAVSFWTTVPVFFCLLRLEVNPLFAPVVGIAIALLFSIYWAGISMAWLLLRKLFAKKLLVNEFEYA